LLRNLTLDGLSVLLAVAAADVVFKGADSSSSPVSRKADFLLGCVWAIIRTASEAALKQ